MVGREKTKSGCLVINEEKKVVLKQTSLLAAAAWLLNSTAKILEKVEKTANYVCLLCGKFMGK